MLYAGPTEGTETKEVALARIDTQIAYQQRMGDVEKEGEYRWERMVALKNYSYTEEQLKEAEIQMEWFRSNDQWDNYYRTWQLKANALSAQGKMQQSLQETQ